MYFKAVGNCLVSIIGELSNGSDNSLKSREVKRVSVAFWNSREIEKNNSMIDGLYPSP